MRGAARTGLAAVVLLIVGIVAGSLGAATALLSIGGGYPWGSLDAHGEDERALGT